MRGMHMGFVGWIVAALVVLLFVQLILVLGRRDKKRTQRPHPKPEEGGDSFGDTTHWGGLGKGGGGF
jgi:hypothetical protein